jgi:DNA-binding transcriptional MerR regulator
LLGASASARAMDKSPDAFRTISEVAEDLDLPQHVLRFWETRFSQIRPLKRGGGRRYYRPDDVDLLKGIRHLLYGQGYTIKGVQRILKSDGIRFVQSIGRGERTIAAAEQPGFAAGQGADDDDVDLADDRVEAEQDIAARDASFHGPSAETALQRPQGLPGEAVAALEAALDELLECERVLATLRDPGTGSG